MLQAQYHVSISFVSRLGALSDEQTGKVVQNLCANDIAVYRVEEHRESLEDIFLNLTGKEMTL